MRQCESQKRLPIHRYQYIFVFVLYRVVGSIGLRDAGAHRSFLASVLPVWMLLAPRDYLSTFMKIGTIVLLAVGILVTLPVMQNEAVQNFFSEMRSIFEWLPDWVIAGAVVVVLAVVVALAPAPRSQPILRP
jgi:hypothetical protein